MSIKIYKCHYWEHTNGTLPRKNSDDIWLEKFNAIEKKYNENKTYENISEYNLWVQYGKPKYIYYWKDYWEEKITPKNNYVYKCKACLFIKNRNKKFNEKHLPDDYVAFKLMGKSQTKEEIEKIPKLLIQTKREILKLKNIIKYPVKICDKHGKLFVHKGQVIKAGKEKSGAQRYKCKQCMKDYHKEHYKNNKEKVLAAHEKYKNQDPEKYRNIKNASKRKCWALNKEKYIKNSIEYDKKNPDKKRARQKRFKNNATKELRDVYVKQQIVRGTELLHKHIPQEMVDITRVIMKIKRISKNNKEK